VGIKTIWRKTEKKEDLKIREEGGVLAEGNVGFGSTQREEAEHSGKSNFFLIDLASGRRERPHKEETF